MYEFYCLLSGFIVFQSAMAFTFEALDPTRVMNAILTQLNLWVVMLACVFYAISETIQIRKIYGGLKYELNTAHNALAEQIITASAKTYELHAMRDQVEMDWNLHTMLDEADRLAHGGKAAVERYRKKHHLDDNQHGEVKSTVDSRISYRSEKNGHIHHCTLSKLPRLLAKGEVTHDSLAWQLGMPLHAVPLSQCEEHFDMHSAMAAHAVEANPRLAQTGLDPHHPSAPQTSADTPEMLVHDRLTLVRIERGRLTKERDEYVQTHDIEKLVDTVAALDAIEAYEKLLTGEDELMPVAEDGSYLDDIESMQYSNPLLLEGEGADGEQDLSARNDWWLGPASERPFPGASMEPLVKLGITGPPPKEHHRKRVLEPGDGFVVLSVKQNKQPGGGVRLEILTPDRKVGWINPVDSTSKQPVITLSDAMAVQGSDRKLKAGKKDDTAVSSHWLLTGQNNPEDSATQDGGSSKVVVGNPLAQSESDNSDEDELEALREALG